MADAPSSACVPVRDQPPCRRLRALGVSPPRVLIVDDHPSFRDAARELLRARGFTVVAEADGGTAALEALGRFSPDAVLLDVRLAGENGFDVARTLTRRRPELAVLLVSADDAGLPPERVRECGARGFVLKRRLVRANLRQLWGI
jgi:DNA-binding NarL/FixJ family response regulator